MKLMVAVPCQSMMHTVFVQSLLNLRLPEGSVINFAEGSLTYDARNNLAVEAYNMHADAILWLDSDMAFDNNLCAKLFNAQNSSEAEIVTGLYFTRREPIEPVLVSKLQVVQEETGIKIVKETAYNYPKNSIFDVDACGFGCVLTTMEAIAKVIEAFGNPFSPIPGMSEDYSFCYKAKQAGCRIVCDSSIQVQHIGNLAFTEKQYRESRRKKK